MLIPLPWESMTIEKHTQYFTATAEKGDVVSVNEGDDDVFKIEEDVQDREKKFP